MQTQRCNRCREIKAATFFNWRWKNRGLRQRTCRTCQNEQKKQWYQRNKESHKRNVYQNKKRNIPTARNFIWQYLSVHPCVGCGETDPSVLKFDHVRGKKRAEVTKMMPDGYSFGLIQAEIEKCVVLRANCHKNKTYRDTSRDR